MDVGLALFLFLLVLLLVSLSPRKDWRLDEERPLDDDDLPWPAAGYGSAAVSLNCLFSAYSAVLFLIGYVCFAGTILGFMAGLFALNIWLSDRGRASGFQTLLYNLSVFASPVHDRLFWLLVAFCQFGLAMSEMILLNHVFLVGLGFPHAHSFAATLFIATVAYFYGLVGGYKAVFRTDMVQFVFIVLMGIAMLLMLGRSGSYDLSSSTILPGAPLPAFLRDWPVIRAVLELLSGFALGIMPILAAPDAWKRVIIVGRRRPELKHVFSSGKRSLIKTLHRALRVAPWRLLFAAVIPVALIAPLLLKLATSGVSEEWSFPLRTLFSLAPEALKLFLILGMVAAFMSTFDSAQISGVHLLLKQRVFFNLGVSSESRRYRVVFGATFAVLALLLLPLLIESPHPYILGAFLIGPFGVVAGVLAGTSFGARGFKGGGIAYLLAVVAAVWLFMFARYCTNPAIRTDPYAAAPVVALGCLLFFVVTVGARILSRGGASGWGLNRR